MVHSTSLKAVCSFIIIHTFLPKNLQSIDLPDVWKVKMYSVVYLQFQRVLILEQMHQILGRFISNDNGEITSMWYLATSALSCMKYFYSVWSFTRIWLFWSYVEPKVRWICLFCLQYSKTYIFKLLRTVDTLTTLAS